VVGEDGMQVEGKEKANHVEKEVGNVNADSDISFEYGVRPGVDLAKQNIESLPFQVQARIYIYTHLLWGNAPFLPPPPN
jgi:hypothetical protein